MTDHEPVSLDNESYSRWIRALRPQPLGWFLSQHDTDQETMACIGDEYQEDFAIGLGYAIRDPDAAAAGLGQEDAEEAVLARLGAELLHRVSGKGSPLSSLDFEGAHTHSEGSQGPRPRKGKRDPLAGSTSVTMGGRSSRQADRLRQEAEERSERLSLIHISEPTRPY